MAKRPSQATRRPAVLCGQGCADPAQRRVRPGTGDACDGLAAHDQGPGKQVGTGFGSRGRRFVRGFARSERPLGDRSRLAGQGGLIDRQDIAGRQDAVCGQPFAFTDQHHIARNQVSGGYHPLDPVADHAGPWLGEIAKGAQGPFAAAFLQHDQPDGGDRAAHQEQTFAQAAEHQIEPGGSDKQQEHRLAHRLENDAQQASSGGRGQGVGTIPDKAGRCLGLGQAEIHRLFRAGHVIDPWRVPGSVAHK